jgi:hypothetical protein
MIRAHERAVESCVAEIWPLLPDLAEKYTALVLVAAITEHVASSLFQTQQRRECTPELARAIIERVRQLAFAP